ncbi:hypothetical protein QE152_g13523 [Popillia japonica]|uniref:Uncharacterized protein n=1 Tax=Popillia japonica TaxID=7064 RepID=A0AAW1LDG5_POPJA
MVVPYIVLNYAYIGSIDKGINRGLPTPYWWNATINEKRTACIATRRKLTRKIQMLEKRRRLKDLYRIQKKDLRKHINESKRKHWINVCKELEDDIWGAGYKIAVYSTVAHNMKSMLSLIRSQEFQHLRDHSVRISAKESSI